MNLNVNYAALSGAGNSVKTNQQEFSSQLAAIREQNASLEQSWLGQDASSYTNAVATQMEYMKKLETTIGEIGDFLIKASKAYEEAMEANVNGIKG